VIEGRSEYPILRDPKAEEIVARINDSLRRSDMKLLRRLGQFKVSRSLAVHAALRARKYDAYALDFMKKNPTARSSISAAAWPRSSGASTTARFATSTSICPR
jgi:O-methyltransferase involved in polyketide biosynthesis